MTRAWPCIVAACAAAVLAGACGEKPETLRLPATPTRVTVALDDAGAPDATLAPLYAAVAGGEFTRAGLTVSVTAPGAGRALATLADGAADFAVVSEPDLLVARDHGVPVVAVAVLVRGPLAAIISLPPHPIGNVTQLEGTTIGAPSSPLANAEIDTILRRAGVDPASVTRRDPGTDPARTLAARKVAALLGQIDTDATRLAAHHPALIAIDAAGVPPYDRYVLAVRQTDAHFRGPLLRTFLQALNAGLDATVAHPATAADDLAAPNPGLSRRAALADLKAVLPLINPAGTGSPYGFVDPRVWRTFGAWLLAEGLRTRSDDAALAVTNEFLPGQGE